MQKIIKFLNISIFVFVFISINLFAEEKFILDMVHHNPGEPATQSMFRDPKTVKSYGYNGQVQNDYVQASITFESFDKTIFPKGSKGREWVDNRAKQIHAQIKAAHKSGIKIYYFTDFIVLPKALVKKYSKEICNKNGDIDIFKPLTQKLMHVVLREIFEQFPEIDGLVIRTGEVYPQNVPFHQGNNPIIDHGLASHKILLDIMREEVCVKRNKKLFYRTWDFGILHTRADNYKKLSDMIEPHKNLFFSIKYTNGDFHRTMKFNTTIGVGRHKQIIEVQCQREYEGKGAHPDYICKGVIDGFEELKYIQPASSLKSVREFSKNPLFAGVWTWTRGGGWRGPYIKNEFWCQLNAYVMAQWTKDTSRSEEEIFNEFAAKQGIMGINLKRFRKLCLLSADGIVRGRACTHGGVRVWWTRDHYIGIPPLRGIRSASRRKLALAEKSEAVAIWQEIEQCANKMVLSNKKLQKYIRVSSTYGRIKYSIFEKAWLMTNMVECERKIDKIQLAEWIKEYDALWTEFKDLKKNNPCCATLYHNKAMKYVKNVNAFGKPGIGALVDSYRKLIK